MLPCLRVLSLQLCPALCHLWTVACQAPLSLEFSRQEYCSGLSCPAPRDLPDPGVEPTSLASSAVTGRFFTTSTSWEAHCCSVEKLCWLFATPWTAAARLPCPSLPLRVCSNSGPLSRWCYLTISPSIAPLILLPSIFPSIRVFSNESAVCIRWPKYRSFSFSVSPSSEYSGLISFRIDWFDLIVVQGTLQSLLQHHN